jgi:hypothetical protein
MQKSKTAPTRRPLGELDPNAENGTKKFKTCQGCRDRVKKKDNSRRMDKKQERFDQNWPICSWQELYRRINDGYCGSRSAILMLSSLETDSKTSYRFVVTGFYEAQQVSKPQDPIELKQTSRIVVDTIGAAHGVKFSKRETYQLKGERGVPAGLAKCSRMRYDCKQRRHSTAANLPITKPQRVRQKRERFDCGGKINLYFPNCQADTTFDFAIEYEHTAHDGANRVGSEGMVESPVSTC